MFCFFVFFLKKKQIHCRERQNAFASFIDQPQAQQQNQQQKQKERFPTLLLTLKRQEEEQQQQSSSSVALTRRHRRERSKRHKREPTQQFARRLRRQPNKVPVSLHKSVDRLRNGSRSCKPTVYK